jgi:hypothetical protein
MLSNVDDKKSTSFKASDREKIFNVIQSTVGFRAVNQDTIKLLKALFLRDCGQELKTTSCIFCSYFDVC